MHKFELFFKHKTPVELQFYNKNNVFLFYIHLFFFMCLLNGDHYNIKDYFFVGNVNIFIVSSLTSLLLYSKF